MKKYECIHTYIQRTRAEWLDFFARYHEPGDLWPEEKFEEFVRNGDLKEV